jgi:hypothetical protein
MTTQPDNATAPREQLDTLMAGVGPEFASLASAAKSLRKLLAGSDVATRRELRPLTPTVRECLRRARDLDIALSRLADVVEMLA